MRNADSCSTATVPVRAPVPASRDCDACNATSQLVSCLRTPRNRRSEAAKYGLSPAACSTTRAAARAECTPGNPAYRGTCNHSITFSMQIAGHATQSWSGGTFYTSPINQTISDTLGPVEGLTCLLSDGTDCPDASFNAAASCPVMGSQIFGEITDLKFEDEICRTRLKANGPYYGCTTTSFGLTNCTQPVIPWCSNTTQPDLDPLTIISGPPQWNYTWDDVTVCVRLSNGIFSTGWIHGPGAPIRNPTLNKNPLCTYNP